MRDFNSLLTTARSYGETNTCTVIMTAIVLDTTYEDAWNITNKAGRKPRKGMVTRDIFKPLEGRGIQVSLIYKRSKTYINGKLKFTAPVVDGDHSRLRDVKVVNDLTTYLPRHGTFIIQTKGHVLTVVDGKVQDWTEGRLHRVLTIYKVTGTPCNHDHSATIPEGLGLTTKQYKAPSERTRRDKTSWELVRLDTGMAVTYYKRKPSRVARSIQAGTAYLPSAPEAPLALRNLYTGEIISKKG